MSFILSLTLARTNTLAYYGIVTLGILNVFIVPILGITHKYRTWLEAIVMDRNTLAYFMGGSVSKKKSFKM